ALLNLDASEVQPPSPWPATVDPANPPPDDSYNWATALTVFDSLGYSHNLSLYFRKLNADPTATPPIDDNTWEVYALVDGRLATATPHLMVFDSNGALSSGDTLSITGFDPG